MTRYVTLGLLSVLWFIVIASCYHWLDLPFMLWLHQHASNSLIKLASYVTLLGETIYPAGVLLALFALSYLIKPLRSQRRFFIILLLTILFAGIACDLFKIVLGRARPTLWLHHNLFGFFGFNFNRNGSYWSFPSGHSTTIASLGSYLWLSNRKPKLLWPIIIIAVLISRLVLSMHYLSDTLAGAYLGGLCAYLVYTQTPSICSFWRRYFTKL